MAASESLIDNGDTMKATVRTIKPRTVPAEADTAMTFADDGRVGLPADEAKTKLEAFLAKHPLRTIRKGRKDTVELVKEARDSRDRR